MGFETFISKNRPPKRSYDCFILVTKTIFRRIIVSSCKISTSLAPQWPIIRFRIVLYPCCRLCRWRCNQSQLLSGIDSNRSQPKSGKDRACYRIVGVANVARRATGIAGRAAGVAGHTGSVASHGFLPEPGTLQADGSPKCVAGPPGKRRLATRG